MGLGSRYKKYRKGQRGEIIDFKEVNKNLECHRNEDQVVISTRRNR